MKTAFLSVILLLSLTSSAFAADCISAEEMTEISSHFTQFKNLSGKEFCYDGSQTSNLLATMMFMRKTAFEGDMRKSTDDLFSGRFSSDWYNYFIGRIEDMEVESSCPPGVGAFVYAFGGKTMYVCPMMLTDSFSALDRASVFMHEARHIDGFPHTTCSHGARKNMSGACDESIAEGGSYAVTVETYAQLAKYATDLHPALKAYSLASAVTYADETFETPTHVDRVAELLIMDKNKNFHALDINGSGEAKALGQSPALGHIVSRGQHLILFPDDKTLPAKYVFAKNEGDLGQEAGDIPIRYNAQSPEKRAELLDVHIGAQWTAEVYSDKISFVCGRRSTTNNEVSLNGKKALGILYVNGYDRASRTNYLATEDGSVIEFGCTESGSTFARASSLSIDKKFKRVQKVDKTLVGLTHDGHLFRIEGTTTTPIKTAVDGQIHEISPRQSIGFMEQE